MLTDKIRLSGPETNEPEDYLSSSLAVIFPDDITNQHGDNDHGVIYQSTAFGEIHLALADPQGDDNRRLFSHFLWNAGLQLAEFIEEGSAPSKGTREEVRWDVKGKRVLELGAGTGLSGIIASRAGAAEVVITDYPAPEVLANLRTNVAKNIPAEQLQTVKVEGHSWGVFEPAKDEFVGTCTESFTRILVADCLWMPWQHRNLMKSIAWFLEPKEGRAWVVAGFHTGRAKMAGFYDEDVLAEEGLEIEKIWEMDAEGKERQWVIDRGIENPTERKRWLVIGILRRKI